MRGQQVWADWIKSHAPEVACDSYGSTWATLPGKSKRVIMLEAHADEIGYMIKHIDDRGFLRIDRVGGSDAATARGRRLTILGDKGPVSGIIGNTAIHLRRDEAGHEKAPAVHDLWVDVGASSAAEVAALGLRVGHPAVYQDGPMELSHKRLIGRALDNRIGSYIIAQVMKRIAAGKKKPAFTLLCLNAVQEEIGGNGAMMATYRLKPDLCVCLDVTHATDTPGIDPNKFGSVKLGARSHRLPRLGEPPVSRPAPHRRRRQVQAPAPARSQQPVHRHRHRQDLPQPRGHPQRARLPAAALHALRRGNRPPRRHPAHHRPTDRLRALTLRKGRIPAGAEITTRVGGFQRIPPETGIVV